MNIIVCIKQVPDTTEIKWTENNTIQREGVESIINPYDIYALEEALKLKKNIPDTNVTVVTMGPLQAQDMLKKTIAIGCDEAVLISDKKFAGADTYATAKTIAAAIKTFKPDFDLIICGQFAIDGDTAQTGPGIATQLGIPQITFSKGITKIEDNYFYAVREIEEGLETVKFKTPALLCVLKGYQEPTRATINGIKRAQHSEIKILSLEDIGLSPEQVGIKGSPTYVSKAFRPERKRSECNFCDIDSLIENIERFGGINE